MAGNPRVARGTLNRLRGSVQFTDFPDLNVTASNLAKAGIAIAAQGATAELIAVMTGTVPSPEPYVQLELTINILKTQALADVFKKQWEANVVVGDLVVNTDAATLSKIPLVDCAITSIPEFNFAGTDPTLAVKIQGTYEINSDLWSVI
ncbi:hypothetical protein [Paraburkholderia caribensis]|uniref:hypothetical protein n=1 Tax=Paraburkholderia caribensis TaxID=75105 RepID=UPI002090137E|nr:hypothetical protein [Paraburkholderia caribensis]MCO4880237.1 hypothetical protein [Paraburkholderia caribensis]